MHELSYLLAGIARLGREEGLLEDLEELRTRKRRGGEPRGGDKAPTESGLLARRARGHLELEAARAQPRAARRELRGVYVTLVVRPRLSCACDGHVLVVQQLLEVRVVLIERVPAVLVCAARQKRRRTGVRDEERRGDAAHRVEEALAAPPCEQPVSLPVLLITEDVCRGAVEDVLDLPSGLVDRVDPELHLRLGAPAPRGGGGGV
mmetsp:Transcript_9486/g.23961  ORF Transcript_9486/g.23961 Transcript_9486/m.23961 type:complete len:206 (-) Transcript_9486:632-1249(-)